MAPVIRISDEVFERLKRLGEPFVDTPQSVIARVLDHYDATHSVQPRGFESPLRAFQASVSVEEPEQLPAELSPDADELSPAAALRPSSAPARPFRLFLVPTTTENMDASIRKGVPLQVAREYLTDEQYASLAKAVAPAKDFRCWAVTESNKAVFHAMRPGDIVFLNEKGTGKFGQRAQVLTTLVSEPLAQRIWPTDTGMPWKYIYVLGGLQPLLVRKDKLITALGYNPSFWLPGHIRVSSDRLKKAIEQYGTFEDLLEACRSARPAHY